MIFMLALFLNTYKFGEVPVGVNVDEAGMGYDAYLLSPMLLFLIYSLLKAVQKNKWYLFALSGLLFGITLYSIKYVFLNDEFEFNSIIGYGTLYYFSVLLLVPRIFIALFSLLKIEIINRKKYIRINKENEKNINLNFVMLIYFFSNFIWTFLIEASPARLNGIYISTTYFILIALQYIYHKIEYIFYTLLIIYAIFFMSFSIKYFRIMSIQHISLFDNGVVELVKYLKKYDEKDVYIEQVNGGYWIFEAYADPINPEEFCNTIKINDKYTDTKSFGKFHNGKFDVNEINDDSIYITNDDNKVNILLEKGFNHEKYNKYNIYYK